MSTGIAEKAPRGSHVDGTPGGIAVYHASLDADVPGSGRNILAVVLGRHAASRPEQPVLILKPGLSIDDRAMSRLGGLLREVGELDIVSALSNADPLVNPFSGAIPETPRALDLGAFVSILAPGEIHPLNHAPAHLLLFPAPLVQRLLEHGVSHETLLAELSDLGGRLVIHDGIFVHDPSSPLDKAPSLQAHEEPRPAPWGVLNARIDDWLQEGHRLNDSADGLNECWHQVETAEQVCLHVTHSWGGGVARWVQSFIGASRRQAHLQLRSEGPRSGEGAGQRLSLYAGNFTTRPIASWWLEPVIASTTDEHPQYREIFEYIIGRYRVSRVLVSSLVGHSLDSLRQDCPTIQVLHDFYPVWPLLDVHPVAFLSENSGARLESALDQHALLPDFRGRPARSWRRLGGRWHEAVMGPNVQLVAPSRSVADMLPMLDPALAEVPIEIIPHGLEHDWQAAPARLGSRADGKLRLVVPGRLQAGKGRELLLKALPKLSEHARLCLLGCGKDGEAFFGVSGVDVVINYALDELPELMARLSPDAAALLSTVPETFSYMLSEMQVLGIPVIATSVGSFRERVRDGVDGWLIDPDSDALVDRIAKLAEDRQPLAKMRKSLRAMSHRSASDMAGDYEKLFPPGGSPPHTLLHRLPSQQQTDALAAMLVTRNRESRELTQALDEAKAEIERRTRWARDRDLALKQEQEEKLRWVRKLEDSLAQEMDEHEHTREMLADLTGLHEAVLASSSWKITKPLRVARRLWANFRRARAWNPFRWPLLISQFVRTVASLGWRDAVMRMQTAKFVQEPKGLDTRGLEAIGSPDAPEEMPRHERPLVSIIIPVHNQWLFTAACLRSIAQATCQSAYEVIVIDDASSDETADRLARVKGLDAVSNEQNLGFVGSCNRGAARANGEFIVLLNNDTQVMDGWLDRLLETFQRFPDTGLAGARLVYPDGSLQECGGIVFNDGSGWNYGRGDNADRPEYQHVREVDYCSGACIMVRRKVFGELEGFDKQFAPAYYEDTDLAFRIRDMGLKVRVQPAATVIHHEGITSGTDINAGAKRYQQVNQKKFLQRWQDQLAEHPRPVVNPDDRMQIRAARDHRLKGRVLVIDAYTPEPDQDSGSLRLRYLMECLFDLGYGVTFFPDNRLHESRYTAALQQSGVETWYRPWLDSLHGWFSEHGHEFDFVIVCRHYVAANYVNLIRRHCPQARFLFDTIDLHYLREQRLAELEDSLPLRRSAAQTRRSELSVIGHADATILVSPTEVEVLKKDAPEAKVHVISNIHQVVGSQKPFEDRQDIFFVGGFQHPPNIDAALWFCQDVWPLIQQQLPELRFHLIGSKATEQVKALHGNGVVFHGFVPRLEPFLDGCRLAVAPLRYGAGVKGKVNLSMSRGQPVVATPAAVEGTQARDGEDVLVASDPQAFADAVVRLYRDEALWNRLSANGQKNVEKYFSLDTARRNLQSLLKSFD